MDPVTAALLALKAVAELLTEAMRGQPLDVRERAWRRFDKFWTFVLKRIGIDLDEPDPPTPASS